MALGHSARDTYDMLLRRGVPIEAKPFQLGVRIEQPGATHVMIHGVGLHGLQAAGRALDMGNAGTAMRLFTGLLSAQRFDSQLIGDASLMKRPMERVARPLREMGADVRTHDGTPPVDIRGAKRLRGMSSPCTYSPDSCVPTPGTHSCVRSRISSAASHRG